MKNFSNQFEYFELLWKLLMVMLSFLDANSTRTNQRTELKFDSYIPVCSITMKQQRKLFDKK